MLELVMIVHEKYTMICHNYWYDQGAGKAIMYSTDEGDRSPLIPIDLAMVSKDDNSGAYSYDPVTMSVNMNYGPHNPGLYRVMFSTMHTMFSPIGQETIEEIFRTGILDGKIPNS